MMATSIRVLYDFLVYADISAVFFLCKGKCSISLLCKTHLD